MADSWKTVVIKPVSAQAYDSPISIAKPGHENLHRVDFHRQQQRGAPIAVFDSGKGGVYHAAFLRWLLPGENLVVLADNIHFPLGEKEPAVVRAATAEAVHFLKTIHRYKSCNVACNTATIHFRPRPPVYGLVESAVELAIAAAQTRSRAVIGVIGTKATVRSRFYQRRLAAAAARRGLDVTIRAVPCRHLVNLIQSLPKDMEAAKVVAAGYLEEFHTMPTILILACSHFELHAAAFRALLEPRGGLVIEPSAELAARTAVRLGAEGLLNPQVGPGTEEFLTVATDEAEVRAMRELFDSLMNSRHPLAPAA